MKIALFVLIGLIALNISTAQEMSVPTTVSAPSTRAAESKSNEIFTVCTRGKELRWLRAFDVGGGRCKTYYSKEGYLQVVSSASYFASCEAVLNNVKKNVEEGGFKCSEKSLESLVEIE